MQATDNIGTFTISSTTFIVVASMGIRVLSLKLADGNVYYSGAMKMGSLSSNQIQLIDSDPVTINVEDSNEVIDGFTINAAAGSVYVIAR